MGGVLVPIITVNSGEVFILCFKVQVRELAEISYEIPCKLEISWRTLTSLKLYLKRFVFG